MNARIGIALLFLSVTAAAQTTQQHNDDKEMQELLSIVQQETDVATKSRLNSDYVPGTVSVLEGDELDALGVRTAGEALGLVPGIQAILDPSASNSAIVRGLDFPFNAGNLQVLVDGVPIARQDGGATTSALMIPVSQIERVEVIRGPGSVIYGDFAFMGLVNIITRKEGTRLSARYEMPSSSRLGTLRTAWKAPSGTVVSANASRFSSHDAIGVQPSPKYDERRTFGVFGIQHGGFTLSALAVRREYDPDVTRAGLAFHEKSWAAEARYGRDLRPSLHAEAKVSRLRNDISNFQSALTGDVTKVTLDATWNGWKRQSWFVSADRSRSTIDDAARRTPPPPGQPPPVDLTPLVHDVSRDITGVTLQDRIDVNDSVSVTAGARWDSYGDLQSRVTPRVAAVWRVTDHHIVKAQYAEGFRPPTFFELYQTPAPGVTPRYPFEQNATTELNYIYRDAGRVVRLTLFRSVLSEMIRPGGITFTGDARAQGFEAEWSQQISPKLKIETNMSHVMTSDPRTISPPSPNAVSSGWLGNAMFLLRPMANVVAGVRWNYVGDRVARGGFSVVDFTISRQDLFVPGLALRAGVKNASNENVNYLLQRPNGTIDALVYPRRAAWLELAWRR